MYVCDVPHHLLAMSEAAALLGMSKQGFAKLLSANPDFPEPTALLSVGRIWARDDIEAWATEHGRPVTRPPSADS